ncbi:hypothetical protein BB559_005827 [Furculomyces boomerangus]|uniref:Uncharacterized protein n=2 Tax=Harpellales TaxID=61421 RepID=A0A2T9Y6E3_9FUNG|nr:hypothetical protein BB559_005827 [Furculomyces boomerangus]PVZ97635.1 hypothetical protein BB558_006402 [Smittium angustum]PWA02622.1 hypothetical protein BB558_001238 [Smittium angustum]
MFKEVNVPGAPVNNAPYSRAVIANGFVFVSGQVPTDPVSFEVVHGDITEQTRLSILSLKKILEAAGSSLDKVVKTTVFLSDINEWPAMNVEYAKHFLKPAPARSAFQVANLPFGVKVEIECIALAPTAGNL